nr:MAG TPA: hypothetical protein [Caudoviricetes sp.]
MALVLGYRTGLTAFLLYTRRGEMAKMKIWSHLCSDVELSLVDRFYSDDIKQR